MTTSALGLLNIGTFELLLVLVVAVMLFGGDLPNVARKAARFVGRMRAMANDLRRELDHPDVTRRLDADLRDVRDEIRDVDATIRREDEPPQLAPPSEPEPGADAAPAGESATSRDDEPRPDDRA